MPARRGNAHARVIAGRVLQDVAYDQDAISHLAERSIAVVYRVLASGPAGLRISVLVMHSGVSLLHGASETSVPAASQEEGVASRASTTERMCPRVGEGPPRGCSNQRAVDMISPGAGLFVVEQAEQRHTDVDGDGDLGVLVVAGRRRVHDGDGNAGVAGPAHEVGGGGDHE
jgi:hypothetical protein